MSDIIFLVLAVSGVYLIKYGIDSYKEYQKHKFNTLSELKNIEKKLKSKEDELQKKENDINRIIHDNVQNASWLANRFIDYQEIQDKKMESFLQNKKRPAIKSAQIVSEISKEKRMYCRKAKILQYQLDYLIHIFPMLEDTMQINAQDLEQITNEINNDSNKKTEYEHLKQWLSPEEYMKLSTTDKYQLALDRYLRTHKTAWQIRYFL